ncbi:class I SAM-dependent methyltransferase [Winogradskya humida]|uniref:Methyltransferase domain-containing protein n=1 Tax=Winogradskya humida TaxID=113566 RepID=A0ABQ4A0J7_9ACTN|nr:class I SAM-dependent methyltransferase [Actinoplanes humidus]GIE23872.1 hypothetical protein Ahu01nite_069740 [Actinoplanes humidus]
MSQQDLSVAAGPVPGDAFGQALLKAWRADGAPGVAYEVIERDDGMVTVNDVAKYLVPAPEWNPVERLACERAHGRVLDVGCGPGRHAVQLMTQGLMVIGLEPSPGAAAVARARDVTVVEGTVRGLEAEIGTFDTILLGGQNIGLLENPESAPGLLRKLAGRGRSGASLLGVSMDFAKMRNPVHRDYAERNRSAGRLAGQQRFRVRDGRLATPWFDYLMPSPAELEALCVDTPWRVHEFVTDGPHYLAHLRLD